jgi:hypothetical protein
MTEDLKRKKVVQANDSLRVSMLVMDGVQRAVAEKAPVIAANHRPGYAVLSDEDRTKRAALVADADKALSDRWRTAQPLPPDLAPPLVTAPAATKDAAYASYDQKLEQRWRAA